MTQLAKRNIGVDLARFLAVFGMVYFDMVLFSLDFSSFGEPDGIEWLMIPVDIANGRASALFVILAGVGLTLITGHFFGATPKQGEALRKTRKVVIKRALFLLVVGWAWQASGWWYFSILHFYAFFLIAGVFCVGLSRRTLWTSIALLLAGAVGLNALLTFDAYQDPELWAAPASVITRAEFYDPVLHLREYFFDGHYPIIPWFAYVLFGIWLGRSPLQDPGFRKRVFMISAVVLAVVVGAGFAAKGHFNQEWVPGSEQVDGFVLKDWLGDLLSLDRGPPGPLYMISCMAQGALGYCLCFWLAERVKPGPVVDALVATGQMSFTIYIVRIFIGSSMRSGLFDYLGIFTTPGAASGWYRTALFMALLLPTCWAWKRYIGRGPLEALMRRVSG